MEALINSMEFSFLFLMALPLIATLIALFIPRENLRDGLTIFIALLTFANLAYFVAKLLWPIFAVGQALQIVSIPLVDNVALTFVLEPLGTLFALVATLLWFLTSIYCVGYMRANAEKNLPRFYAFFALSIFATLGIAFSGNLLTLFIFYEMLTLVTFPLVAHHGTPKARAAGKLYLAMLLGTSLTFFLAALVWIVALTGELSFVPGGIFWQLKNPHALLILTFLIAYGVGKAALMPLHRWLPAAMVAPTPVSALLHAVAVVKAGVFSLIKIFTYIFGIPVLAHFHATDWLVWVAGISVVAASLFALQSKDLKQMLAYSTVSQLAYITMAAALATPQAMAAAAFHIAVHAFSKITLFFCAGAIYTTSGKQSLDEMSGIAKLMPWTMAAFTIGALSMIGLPPLSGFLSKFFILEASGESNHIWPIFILIVSSVLNAAYFGKIILQAYFSPLSSSKKHGEASWMLLIPILASATCSVALFIYPKPLLELAQRFVL